MRVTFRRLPGEAGALVLIERDDGVVCALREPAVSGGGMPHGLRHLAVESELAITDGIWGGIAAGQAAPPAAEAGRLARERLAGLAPAALADATRALQVEAARWARLRPGEELVYQWPPAQPARGTSHPVPRPRPPGDRRDPRHASRRWPR